MPWSLSVLHAEDTSPVVSGQNATCMKKGIIDTKVGEEGNRAGADHETTLLLIAQSLIEKVGRKKLGTRTRINTASKNVYAIIPAILPHSCYVQF